MRHRRQDRREERKDDRSMGRRGSGNNRYQMREKLVSIGDDFWIENDHGQKAFKVNGKALRVRQTLKFENAQGQELCKIQERMLRVKDSMEVEDAHGNRVALVKKSTNLTGALPFYGQDQERTRPGGKRQYLGPRVQHR